MSAAKIRDLGRAAGRQALRLPVWLSVIAGAAGCTILRAYAAQAADFQLHQAFRGKADHLAQKSSVRALLQQPATAGVPPELGATATTLFNVARVLGQSVGTVVMATLVTERGEASFRPQRRTA
ncbi:MAG TPA: hypothetical protein VGV17_04555 [Bosea sp. (in: a-proteobacteria)]|jgi:hypothetical protein|uniref:hypothetical protein n=1 Tax=Bosea sp. (in: a-proteobacteria) TaxID=1871050 RepID=UPI002DDD453C|nr:hypothetical protein [Bosea sp. (in: a-proteobacteria)]HEV2553017.1 hypothetical protein [Bosea sp. (in: a-proteobacteria)]